MPKSLIEVQKILGWFRTASRFRQLLIAIFALRIVTGIVSVLHPLGGPHQWRQSDTMGVAIRFWSRWVIEPTHAYPLLGAVLQSGDHRGIVNSELPLLPMIAAPAFAFGPEVGRQLAQGIFLSLVLALLWLCHRIWRDIQYKGINGTDLALLVPLFSFAAPFFSKFIPDLLAMLLCFMAIGLIIREPQKISGAAIGLASIGLLLKPTAIITFFPFILTLRDWRQFRPAWFFYVVPIVVAALYFGVFNAWVDTLRDGKVIFRASLRSPWENISSVLSDIGSLASCLNYHLFFPFGFWLMAVLFFIHARKSSNLSARYRWIIELFAIIVLQVAFILIVDGNHAFTHAYYFIGIAPVAAALFLQVWRRLTPSPAAKVLLALLLFGRNFEIGATEMRAIFRPGGTRDHLSECHDLKATHPEVPWRQGLVFRSPGEEYSFLGVCFGERDMSETFQWGFIELENLPHLPAGCEVSDKRTYIALIRCAEF